MGQKMGKKGKKGDKADFSEEQLDTYIRAEFKAMDSITGSDGKLHRQEVLDLLTMLGYSKGNKKLKELHVKSEEHVELEDYFKAFKADKEMTEKTMRFRYLFQMFDSNHDGTASKEEVTAGLEKVDIKVDEELQRTIEQMDTNADGKITYQEFLATEFKINMNKGNAKKDKKKKSRKSKKDKKKDKESNSESESEDHKEKKKKDEGKDKAKETE